jgi:ferritin
MLSEKMQEALNGQINAETYSAYLYLSMSAYLESINLPGFAAWMRVQASEEMKHAMKFYEHITERRGRVTLKAVAAPPKEWSSPLNVFEDVFKHEQKVTGLIHDLVKLAGAEGDHAAGAFLQWFVTEQVEEEASADAVLQKLKLVGDSPGPLFMLDHELGRRQAGGD